MRVLVVRPDERARETAARLVACGHVAVLAPVLSIVPTGRLPPLGAFDGVLVTSRNALPALLRHRERFATAEVFALGARTGATLEEAGFRRLHVAGGDAAALAALAGERMLAGARLLHAAGRDRRREPAASLLAQGHAVETWVTYEAEAASRLPDAARDALAAGGLDAILHYSPRSAAILKRLVQQAGLGEAWGRPLHACLSANVAAALGEALRIAVAAEPAEHALFGLLGSSRRTD
jgi:uroporphyrinogen-III synthase